MRFPLSTQLPSSDAIIRISQYLASADYAQAEAQSRSALTIEQHHCDLHHALGISLLHQQQYAEAVATLSNAAALSMQYHHFYHYEASAMHTLRAALYEALGNTEGAMEEYRTALHLDHLNHVAKSRIEGKTTDAAYTTAPELTMDIKLQIRLLNTALGSREAALAAISDDFHHGRYEKAANALSALPLAADTAHDLACCQIRMKQMDEAARSFAQALDLEPGHSYALFGLARLAAARQDHETAFLYLGRAIAACGARHEHYHAQASLHHEHRAFAFSALLRFDEAIRDYSKALDLNRKNIDAYLGRAEAYAQKGNHREACADYQMALALDPTSARAQDGLKKAEQTAWAS